MCVLLENDEYYWRGWTARNDDRMTVYPDPLFNRVDKREVPLREEKVLRINVSIRHQTGSTRYRIGTGEGSDTVF